ncbi:aminoacyl tRNA synthase complex-interacting multifunctional protein 1 isoform X2 [Morus notabilis]|uniref:aminoacyl tRNA synthase complex-interacting multifunctional protein 1 isoform X1 n=1 Tax=Morus notabilis TaxID=981085 RepID=UPI000CED7EED|nr:aminoacyl tRNA synthase complex-interacting multifunctional protein 1 isoform X1 [Morus notabilis]XP_024024599.1 aminoacyl tRNA synthase complex-interacting multifunctional protein 1 isoform X2 [Morus notabilis]
MAAANLLKGSGGVGVLLCSSSASSSLGLRRMRLSSLASQSESHYNYSYIYNYQKLIPTSHDSLSLSLSTRIGVRGSRSRRFCNSSATAETENATAAEEDKARVIKETADLLDIRVGRILKARRHEEADSLYVEEVDVGEPQPRIICSGLVNYIPLHLLQDARVVVLANLKPRNMRGVKSYGMLMAASDTCHSNVELLVPPEGSIPGDRIWFGSEGEGEGEAEHQPPPPASPNQIQKKKIWEAVQPHLKTNDSCVATLLGEHVMRASAGLVFSTSLKNANIS